MMIRGFEENMKEFNKQMDYFNDTVTSWRLPPITTSNIPCSNITGTAGVSVATYPKFEFVKDKTQDKKKKVYRAESYTLPNYKKVIFNNPYTIVLWEDGTKTTVKVTDGDTFSEEAGFALCMLKKMTKDSFKGIFKDVIKNASRPDYSKKKDKKD